jgi:protein-L-isoaspartate(D-aspartate) O-methyltransferase
MHATPYERARFNMIEQQIRPAHSCSDRVLELLQNMPRERFVPEGYEALAYADTRIPLAHGCMPTPILEAAMLEALNPGSADNILEIGTGNGFLTACLAKLGGYVTSLDAPANMSTETRERLNAQGISNVSLIEGSLDQLPGGSFDAILVSTGALNSRHPALEAKLTQGGRLFAIIGKDEPMQACLIRRTSATDWDCQILFETWLPPLDTEEAPKPAFQF